MCKEVEWIQMAQGSDHRGLLGLLKLLASARAQEFLDHRVQLHWLATLLKCTLMLQPDTLNCFVTYLC